MVLLALMAAACGFDGSDSTFVCGFDKNIVRGTAMCGFGGFVYGFDDNIIRGTALCGFDVWFWWLRQYILLSVALTTALCIASIAPLSVFSIGL
jgi:hypothetical protein